MTPDETLKYVEQRYSNMPPSVIFLYKEYHATDVNYQRLLRQCDAMQKVRFAKLTNLVELVDDVKEELGD